jgi:hypothetical protein
MGTEMTDHDNDKTEDFFARFEPFDRDAPYIPSKKVKTSRVAGMTRPDLHDAAFGLLGVAAAAIVSTFQAPDWIRWFGLALAVPAIALFIATAPRSQR